MRRAAFDASVLVKLAVPEHGTAAALAAYRSCEDPVAPAWVMLECGQALWRKTHRGEYSSEKMRCAYDSLTRVGLRLAESETLPDAAFGLALAVDHTVYDCMYVALALAEDASLVTADARLRDVARAAGVEVVWIDSGI